MGDAIRGGEMAKVSVIVPVYNVEKYLDKCLSSLVEQTLSEIEIIIVDDGSTDSSPEIIKRYAEKYENIISVQKENGGLSDARNFGLPFASGEYIGYLDSDDYIDSEMYEVMYEKAKSTNSDIVECNLHHTYQNYEDTEIMTKLYAPGELLTHGRCIVWNKIYNRKWLLDTGVMFQFRSKFEDLDFYSRIVPFIRKYEYVDIAPIHYVQRSGSLNYDAGEDTIQIFGILHRLISYYKERGIYSQFEKELEHFCARNLLCNIFERMCRISNKKIRKIALKRNWNELNEMFPNWRKNPILLEEKSRKATFMKLQGSVVYRTCCAVFPIFFRIKDIVTVHRKL